MISKVIANSNPTKLLMLFAICCLVQVFTLTKALAQASGTFMVVKGDVQITSKSGSTQKAKIGMKVQESDLISSGPDSRAKIVMADKNVINISPDTKLELEKYIYDPNSDNKQVSLNVLQGKVRATVEQKYDGEKNKFHVKTPSAVAGVRGTDFLTSFSPKNRETKIVTFEGRVAVGLPGPNGGIANPVYVNPGQTTTAQGGTAPNKPQPVPANELNSMKSESQAETAKSSDKKDVSSGDSKDKEDKKEEAKKEENKEDKKEETKEENKKEESKKEEAKEDKKEDKKETKEDKKDAKEDKKEAKKEEAKDSKKEATKESSKEKSNDSEKSSAKEPEAKKTEATAENNSGGNEKNSASNKPKDEPKDKPKNQTAASSAAPAAGTNTSSDEPKTATKAPTMNMEQREPASIAAPPPSSSIGATGSMINTTDLMPNLGDSVINPNVLPVMPTTNFEPVTAAPITEITNKLPQDAINNANTNTSSKVNIIINRN